MFCNHCGKPNPDGTKICTSCGLEIITGENAANAAPAAAPVNAQPAMNPNLRPNVPMPAPKQPMDPEKKKKLIKLGGIGAAALVILAIIIAIIVSESNKLSLKDYVATDLTYSGLNGNGTYSLDELVNWDALQNDIMSKKSRSSLLKEIYNYTSNNVRDYVDYECSVEENGHLSNGDKIVITFDIDRDGIKNNKAFKKTIKGDEYQEFEFTVSGLEDGEKVDFFDAIESVTVDTTYYNRATINYKKDYVKKYSKDGINVKVENDRVMLYGDNFHSIQIYFNVISDNIDETTKTVKVSTNIDQDYLAEQKIVAVKTEADVKTSIITMLKSGTIAKDDLTALTKKVKETKASDWTYMDGELEKVILYWDADSSQSRLCYYFKGAQGYSVAYNQNLKVSGGKILDIDECRFNTEGGNFWGFTVYANIAEYEANMTFTEKFDIPLS